MAADDQLDGRADPADVAHGPDLSAEVEVEPLDPPGPPPRPARSHFLAGVLLATGVAAAFVFGGLVLGANHDGDEGGDGDLPAWSKWQPSESGNDGAEQIAGHVGPRYRGTGGGQLVGVRGGPLEVAGLPLTVAVRVSADAHGEVELFDQRTVLYRLCGSGQDCAIDGGAPSVERHMLLRREALELALYSLRYLDAVDQVVVFMPPRRGDQASQALFFRRAQMTAELEKPLEATLVDRAPTVARMRKSPDAGLVQRLTLPTLFRFRITDARRDDGALLLLDPLDWTAPLPAPVQGGSPGSSLS